MTAPLVAVQASYSFLAEQQAQIGGCTYRAIPVQFTATFGGKPLLQRRSLYFPDLQISVMTIWGPDAEGPRLGLGILALSPSQ